ncbi:MAG: shikimate dehydrogenase family protein, partial [Candidatus Odinarchaeia archaeon]
MEAEIDGNTGFICLLGNPVSHYLSPLMQNYALRKNNFNAVYLAFKVTQENLKTAIDGLKSLNFIGANVTIPFKVKIIPFLDKIDETTNKIGAVNTIVNKNGILWGYNTDGLAAVDLIKQEIGSLKDKQFLILGAGGVARAISYF